MLKSTISSLRIVILILLALLTFEGWLGGSISFSTLHAITVTGSFTGFYQAIIKVGPRLMIHVINAFLILALGIVVLDLAFRNIMPISLKMVSLLGLFAIAAAMIGGSLFVLSDFRNHGYLNLMDTGTLGVYVAYLILLPFSFRQSIAKKENSSKFPATHDEGAI